MPPLVDPCVPPGTLARQGQPRLARDGIVLRPWRTDDASAVVLAYADPDIRRWHVRSMTGEEAVIWIDSWPKRWELETGAGWAITDDRGPLGQISLRRFSFADGLAEASYWVLPAARGNGIATNALRALTGWAFDSLGLNRIEIVHSTSNPKSCRVASRAGYDLEGTKRREALHVDGWHDMHLHARLRDSG